MPYRQKQAITITITIGMRALSLLEGERELGVAVTTLFAVVNSVQLIRDVWSLDLASDICHHL